MSEPTGGAQLYSFRGKLVAAFWKSSTVRDQSIRGMAEKLRARLPNVNAIAVRTNSGPAWIGTTNRNAKPSDLDINGVGDVKRWADACAELRLDCVAWCVVKGEALDQEAERIAEVCAVPGISAMILDVEVGESYFQGSREDAHYLARKIRQLAPDAYLGLCFDARGHLPGGIYIQEWLPSMSGLHPMIYPETFGRDPVLAVRDAFGVISKFESYSELPVTVWVGAHSLEDTGSLSRAVHTIFDRSRRAEGLVLWRYGDDVMRDKEFRTVRQLTIPYHVAAPRPIAIHVTGARMKLREALRRVAYRTQLIRIVHRLRR